MEYKTEYHVTPCELRQVVDYEPSTGVFTWKTRPNTNRGNRVFNSKFAGRVAGGLSNGHGDGYLRIKVYGKMLKAHRAAFACMNGEWPEGYVDHIDGDIQNNCWNNLRIVSKIGNGRNQKLRCTNKWGISGVSHTETGMWVAIIGGRGTERFERLIRTPDFFEACCARKSAELRHGYHENHGRI